MPRQKEFNEEEVLSKATDLFWKKGYNATSIQDLVSELGINRASLYDTFGGKQELYQRSLTCYRTGVCSSVNSLLYSSESVRESFRTLFMSSVESLVGDKDSKGCFVVNTTAEHIPEENFVNDSLEKNREFFESAFRKRLKEGVESGELSMDKDANSLASYLFTFNNGLGLTSKIIRDKKELKNIVEAALTVLD